jgi:hypothetical protein
MLLFHILLFFWTLIMNLRSWFHLEVHYKGGIDGNIVQLNLLFRYILRQQWYKNTFKSEWNMSQSLCDSVLSRFLNTICQNFLFLYSKILFFSFPFVKHKEHKVWIIPIFIHSVSDFKNCNSSLDINSQIKVSIFFEFLSLWHVS